MNKYKNVLRKFFKRKYFKLYLWCQDTFKINKIIINSKCIKLNGYTIAEINKAANKRNGKVL